MFYLPVDDILIVIIYNIWQILLKKDIFKVPMQSLIKFTLNFLSEKFFLHVMV